MTNTKSIIVFAKCHKLDGKTVDGMEFNVIGAIFLLFVRFGEKIDKPFSYEFSLYFCLQPLFTPRLVLNVTFGTLNSFLYEFTSHSMLFIYFFFSLSLFLFLSFPLFFLLFIGTPFTAQSHHCQSIEFTSQKALRIPGESFNPLIRWLLITSCTHVLIRFN